MKHKHILLFAAILAALSMIFSSCGLIGGSTESTGSASNATSQTEAGSSKAAAGQTEEETLPGPETVDYVAKTAPEVTPEDLSGVFEGQSVTDAAFLILDEDGKAVEGVNGVYTITNPGTYTLSGVLKDGQIVVDAGEEKVKLILSGVSITSSESAAIKCLSADKLNVEAAEGTYNEIHDTLEKALSSDEDEEVNYDAAIWSGADLDLQGTGTLVVTSTVNNGVKTKDDLEVKDLSLQVTAYNNALKGNDSVLIESGTILLISESSDGIKTSNSDVSNKGNQRGTVTIAGGTVEIRSAKDGIQAAYDVEISGESIVTIYTADYAGEMDAAAENKIYLIVSNTLYSASTDYYAYFYNDDEGKFVKAEYETMISSGRRASYYGLAVKVPSGYGFVRFVTVSAGTVPTTENYDAVSEGESIRASMNGYLFESVSSGTVTGDWVQIGSSSGNSSKTAYSSKGIKAANEIRIKGGTVTVSAMDDALHANGGDKLENGSTGLGNVLVTGGILTVVSADDGIHADGDLRIYAGVVNVKEAHEGLEANQVIVSGGSTFVCGKDDGINATSGSSTPLIEVDGGYLEITTASGDTDAIDSNGNFRMTGGYVLVKGGSSQGSVAGSVDVDGSIEVSGGMIVAFGGICELPSNSVNVYASQGTSFQAGAYSLKTAAGEEVLSFELSGSYSSVWIAGDALVTGTSYVLTRDQSSVLEWTQTEGTAGNYSGGGFGGGFGPGGWPRK